MFDKDSNVDAVETFTRIVDFRIVYWFNGFSNLVDVNSDDVLLVLIVAMVIVVFGTQAFTFMCC